MNLLVITSKDKISDEIFLKLSDAVLELLSDINSNLSSISDSVGFSITDIISWIIPAVVGALSAYFFNKFHWKTVENKQKISNIRDALCEAIEKLEVTSITYWACDYSEENSVDCHIAELSIKANFKIIRRYIKAINNYSTPETEHILNRFVSESFNVITGDEFESKVRKSSREKTSKVSTMCAEVLSTLYMQKHQ